MKREMPTPDHNLVAALRERGQRVTPQRLLIHRALRDLDRHVTAEEVLGTVSDRLPNASLPTVYATLDLFEEMGIVRRVPAAGGATLFDPRTEPHQHLSCRECGRVEDLDVALDAGRALRAARRRGFKADRAELVITGLCDRCAAALETN
jgi:Fe2+ or Zn2+ uptake regulation protein